MRLVLDTNVIVSALLWYGPPRNLVARARSTPLEFCASPPLLLELEDVLGRPKLATAVAASGCTPGELVRLYSRLATIVAPAAIGPIVAADPDDDQVLACAVAAQAELIVTGDRHLLELGLFRGIRIRNTADAIAHIERVKPGG